jgi:hypothetical protein
MLTDITSIYKNSKYLQSLYPFKNKEKVYYKGDINELYKLLNNNE